MHVPESTGGGEMGMFCIAPRDRKRPLRGLFGHARYENSESRILSVDVLIARSHAILAGTTIFIICQLQNSTHRRAPRGRFRGLGGGRHAEDRSSETPLSSLQDLLAAMGAPWWLLPGIDRNIL